MQEERGGLGAQAVLAGGRHPVDPHRLVHVLDPVLDGAHVGVGESVAVAEVQRDARPRPVALCGTNRFSFFFLRESRLKRNGDSSAAEVLYRCNNR